MRSSSCVLPFCLPDFNLFSSVPQLPVMSVQAYSLPALPYAYDVS